MADIAFGYFEKLKFATLIKQEITQRYVSKIVAPYQSDVFKKKKIESSLFNGAEVFQYHRQKVKSVHGILERNLKIVETEDGFEVLVPKGYGEKYIEDCLKAATKRWLSETRLKGRIIER